MELSYGSGASAERAPLNGRRLVADLTHGENRTAVGGKLEYFVSSPVQEHSESKKQRKARKAP
jgi:hypothetical protein